jgi:hypothetical protein
MIYGDEEIIRARVAAQAKRRHTIENEVAIDGVKYAFARRNFEYGFSMVVPEAFEKMPDDVTSRMFPRSDRPKDILCNKDYSVCIAFASADMREESLEARITDFRTYTNRLNPSYVFFSQGISNLPNGLTIGYYDYRQIALDEDLYYITFDFDLQDKEVLGWFICPISVQEKWEPLMWQMIKTITVIEG